MKRFALALFVVAACKSEPAPLALPSPSPSPSWRDPTPRLEFVAAGEGDVAPLVKRELERAKADRRRLVVYVGATWCEPCQRFHDNAVAGTLDAKLPPMRFLEFDLDKDEARLKAAGYASEYIPLFAVPLADGRASGKQIAGSIKGPGAPDEITPRLLRLLAETP